MSAAAILRETAAAGVSLSLSATGTIKAAGEQSVVALWLPAIREHKTSIVALLRKLPTKKPFGASRWLIHFSDRNPLEVAFSPAASHAEVLDAYPDALAAEPADEVLRQPDALLTGDQETEIRSWLAQIGENDQATIDDVLRQCRHDDDARAYYLGRAAMGLSNAGIATDAARIHRKQ